MFNFEFWMMNGGAKRREEERSHAKGAEGAEGKAGHGLKKIGEDVLPAADRSRQRWGG